MKGSADPGCAASRRPLALELNRFAVIHWMLYCGTNDQAPTFFKKPMAKSPAKKTGTLSALDFISHPEKYPVAGVCAVFGDEAYLKSEVLSALRRQVLQR